MTSNFLIYEASIDNAEGIIVEQTFKADKFLTDYIILEKSESKYGLLYITQVGGKSQASLTYSSDFSTTNIRQIYISKFMQFKEAGEGKHIVESQEQLNQQSSIFEPLGIDGVSQTLKPSYFYINYDDDPLHSKLIYRIQGLVDGTLKFQIDLKQQLLFLGKLSAYAFDIGSNFLESAPFSTQTFDYGESLAFIRNFNSQNIEQTRLLFFKSDSEGNTQLTTFGISYFDESYIQCAFNTLSGQQTEFYYNATTLKKSYLIHLQYNPYSVKKILLVTGALALICGLICLITFGAKKNKDKDVSVYTGGRPNSARLRNQQNDDEFNCDYIRSGVTSNGYVEVDALSAITD